MKTLVDHINEAMKIGKDISSFSTYSCQPKTKKELKEIIKERISEQGNKCDLNDIDTSLIDDMSFLYCESKFNGDISKWDVSNVVDMWFMFGYSKFNQPIGNWNVSNVIDMFKMFSISKFNKDISNWKINKDCDTTNMFGDCPIKEEYKPKALQS